MDGKKGSSDANMDLFGEFAYAGAAAAPAGKQRSVLAGAPAGSTHRLTIEQSVGGAAQTQWKPVPFNEGPTLFDTTPCFGCTYGSCCPGSDQPALKGMWTLFRDNHGTMKNSELARLIEEYFVREIKKPMAEQGRDVNWTKEQILTHIEEHMLEPVVAAGTAIQNFRQIARWLRGQVRVVNDKGEKKVDLKALRSLIEVEKMIASIYAGKQSSHLFYSRYMKLDQDRANK